MSHYNFWIFENLKAGLPGQKNVKGPPKNDWIIFAIFKKIRSHKTGLLHTTIIFNIQQGHIVSFLINSFKKGRMSTLPNNIWKRTANKNEHKLFLTLFWFKAREICLNRYTTLWLPHYLIQIWWPDVYATDRAINSKNLRRFVSRSQTRLKWTLGHGNRWKMFVIIVKIYVLISNFAMDQYSTLFCSSLKWIRYNLGRNRAWLNCKSQIDVSIN